MALQWTYILFEIAIISFSKNLPVPFINAFRKIFENLVKKGVLFYNVPNFGYISDDGRWKKMAPSPNIVQ